jgi:hypothetical protein
VTTSWLTVWTRAVVAPAYRRAGGLWAGSAIVGGVIFGPTAMKPHDLTGLALHVPGVAAVLAVTWLLLYLPIARLLVRAEGATFLRSLPGRPFAAYALTALALVGLQLPWLILWVLGEHARGIVIVVGFTVLIAALAAMRVRPRRHRAPHWSSNLIALAAVYRRALTRRATDALLRGAGLAILAGLVGGLMIRNNNATGASAATLATGAIAVVLVPGWCAALIPLVEAQRASLWLASSLGMSTQRRIVALALVVAGVYVVAMLIALVATMITAGAHLLVVPVALASALGASLIATRSVVHADRNPPDAPRDIASRGPASARVVVGAIAGSALVVVALVWLGALGSVVVAAVGVVALTSARPG